MSTVVSLDYKQVRHNTERRILVIELVVQKNCIILLTRNLNIDKATEFPNVG